MPSAELNLVSGELPCLHGAGTVILTVVLIRYQPPVIHIMRQNTWLRQLYVYTLAGSDYFV